MTEQTEQHPPRLPPGTQVGHWRVEAFQGRGAYGAVYRAKRGGFRRSQPGALKVSLGLWNWRMEREVELLSRLNHPSIPRLLDRGGPHPPTGDEHPFFVMEWMHGTPLYAWAEQHSPSGKQLCRMLAQLARALEAVHAAGAVHRDVKGDNVLVRLSDRRAVLIDFGSCHFAGAQRLTWQPLPPVTPAYLSPQAMLFYLRSQGQPDGYYPPSPADDLYALGVVAYRLVMGQYPACIEARQDEHGTWQGTSPDFRLLLESNPRLEPALREVILQLLSSAPEQRGTAGQVAQALEAAAGEEERPERSRSLGRARSWKPWLALAASAAVALMLWRLPGPRSVLPEHRAVSPPAQAQAQLPDAGTATVGGSTPSPTPPASPPPSKQSVSQNPPFVPGPEQARRARPDAKGQCPRPKQMALNGFCWVELAPMTTEECTAGGYMFLKGKCYGPALELPQKTVPTSSPGNPR